MEGLGATAAQAEQWRLKFIAIEESARRSRPLAPRPVAHGRSRTRPGSGRDPGGRFCETVICARRLASQNSSQRPIWFMSSSMWQSGHDGGAGPRNGGTARWAFAAPQQRGVVPRRLATLRRGREAGSHPSAAWRRFFPVAADGMRISSDCWLYSLDHPSSQQAQSA